MRVLPAVRAESIKLEPQTRINVDFKPNKKMRKRRELDALVSNGKNRRHVTATVKKGHHELLRSVDEDEESESSEEIEFALAAQNKSVIRKKRTSCWPSYSYVPMCAFILVMLCLLVCGGLVWYLYELREEVGNIRSEISTVESQDRGYPDEFQSIHSSMKSMEEKMKGGKGLAYLNSQIDHILQQLTYLNKTTKQLSRGQAAAEELSNVPTRVDQITQNVADLGSTVNSLLNDVKDLKSFRTRIETQHAQLVQEVQDIKSQLSTTTTPAPKPEDNDRDTAESPKPTSEDVTELSSALNSLNASLISVKDRVEVVETKMTSSSSNPEPSSSDLQTMLDEAIQKYTDNHEKDISTLDTRLDSVNATLLSALSQLHNNTAQLSNVTKQLQQSTVVGEKATVAPPANLPEEPLNPTPSHGETTQAPAEGTTTEGPLAEGTTQAPSTEATNTEPDLTGGLMEGGDEEEKRPVRRRRSAYNRLRPIV